MANDNESDKKNWVQKTEEYMHTKKGKLVAGVGIVGALLAGKGTIDSVGSGSYRPQVVSEDREERIMASRKISELLQEEPYRQAIIYYNENKDSKRTDNAAYTEDERGIYDKLVEITHLAQKTGLPMFTMRYEKNGKPVDVFYSPDNLDTYSPDAGPRRW